MAEWADVAGEQNPNVRLLVAAGTCLAQRYIHCFRRIPVEQQSARLGGVLYFIAAHAGAKGDMATAFSGRVNSWRRSFEKLAKEQVFQSFLEIVVDLVKRQRCVA